MVGWASSSRVMRAWAKLKPLYWDTGPKGNDAWDAYLKVLKQDTRGVRRRYSALRGQGDHDGTLDTG